MIEFFYEIITYIDHTIVFNVIILIGFLRLFVSKITLRILK